MRDLTCPAIKKIFVLRLPLVVFLVVEPMSPKQGQKKIVFLHKICIKYDPLRASLGIHPTLSGQTTKQNYFFCVFPILVLVLMKIKIEKILSDIGMHIRKFIFMKVTLSIKN